MKSETILLSIRTERIISGTTATPTAKAVSILFRITFSFFLCIALSLFIPDVLQTQEAGDANTHSVTAPVDAGFQAINAGLPGSQKATWGDYDNDGDMDLLLFGGPVPDAVSSSRIYRNNGGTFNDAGITLTAGSSGGWGDYDNDGDLDIVISGTIEINNAHPVAKIYRNDNGSFIDINASLPGLVGNVDWIDYDNDNDLDIFISGSPDAGSTFQAWFYKNNNGNFIQQSTNIQGVWGSDIAWGDFDNDGDVDLAISGYGGSTTTRIYQNINGVFNSDTSLTGMVFSAFAWIDYDNDNDLDLYASGLTGLGPVTTLYQNNNGTFSETPTPFVDVRVGDAAWNDYDFDGDYDVLISGRTGSDSLVTKLYRNDGGSFTDMNVSMTGTWFSAVEWGDYDNDGSMDIIIAGQSTITSPERFVTTLYKNLTARPPGIFELNVNALHGFIEKSPNKTFYQSGSSVTLTAVPEERYSFSNWNGDIPPGQSDVNPLTVIMDNDKDISANFYYDTNLTTLHLTAINGAVTKSPDMEWYPDTTQVVLTAIPNEGYIFTSWSGDVPEGDILNNPLTVVMDINRTIQANFIFNPTNRFLTVNATNGIVTKNPDRAWYDNGLQVTLTPTPLPGYIFQGWSGDISPEDSITNPLILTMTSNKNVTANFIIDPNNFVLALQGEHGTFSKSPNRASYVPGTSVTIFAIPEQGYGFTRWSGDVPPEDSARNPLIIIMDTHKSITATFNLLNVYYALLTFSSNGTIIKDPPGSGYYFNGTPVRLTAQPDTGYIFNKWGGNVPQESLTVNPVTIIMNSHKNVQANFILNPDNKFLTLNATNGSISKTPNRAWHFHGESVTLTATPTPGYLFSHWSGDISSGDSLANPLTVTMDMNRSIQAVFIFDPTNTYLTTSSDHGAISINPNQEWYVNGTEVVLTPVPEPGYRFDSWSGDIAAGDSATNPLTIAMTTNKGIIAHFILGSRITGMIFNDLNEDSMYTPGEPGIEGRPVQLTGKASRQLTTDISGQFAFYGLDSGAYQVSYTVASPWISTSAFNNVAVILSLPDTFSGIYFGQRIPYNTISGVVYYDLNENGTRDALEERMSGWEVRYVSEERSEINVTDSLGIYRFTGIAIEACSVLVIPPSNWEKITPRLVDGYTAEFREYNRSIVLPFGVHPIPTRAKIAMQFHDASYNRITTIQWGVRDGATPGIWNTDPNSTRVDYSEGEEELPLPYPDAFDVRFIKPQGLPAYFGNGSWVDMRPFANFTQVDTFAIAFATGWITDGSYPVTFLWSKELVQTSYNGPVMLRDPNGVVYDMKTLDSLEIYDDEIKFLTIIASTPNLPEGNSMIRTGWNLISVPYVIPDSSINTLFPTSSSIAYSYNGFSGYFPHNSIEPGHGYWLKFALPMRTLPLTGTARLLDTITVTEGWNLIGTLSTNIDTSSVQSSPPGIVAGPYFAYTKGYFAAKTLDTVRGYWVKVNQNGTLILNAGAMKRTTDVLREPEFEQYSRLDFTDAAGNTQTLSIIHLPDNSSRLPFLELPPKPPEEIFDIRFRSNRQIEVNTGEHNQVFPISISSAQYPVTIRLEQRSMAKGMLHSAGSTLLFDQEGVAILYEEPEGLSFHTNSKEVTPSSFTLGQNYPNPFNPLTNFTFQVAGRGTITLTVYSILGEEIATLLHRELDPGTYTIPWDANGQPSGIYFYRLHALNGNGTVFSSMKKMLLLK